ncbi:two-component system sensor histidine kinase NtrB [Candidatus Binatus sp.]|uniref:two-component system sensor histidine kinase NtrB n=1 Tax=Candidatus Binatus sp. TaxID=2811406 RepID=UPI002F95CE49
MARNDASNNLALSGGLNLLSIDRIRPIRIALFYAVAGLIWIAVSDRVLSVMPAHQHMLSLSVNTLLLFLIASHYTRTIRISVAAQEEALVRARGYFESAVEGIVSVDSTGMICQLNPRGQALFGYDEEELVGQPIEVLVPQRFHYRHEAHRDGFFKAPKSRMMGRGMELAVRRKDGSEFPAEISLNVVHQRRGKLVIAFVTDISERRAMEHEARRNETVDALAAVAAGVAHELNNPLAVMAARIELMLVSDQDLSAQARDDLLVLQKNIERASRISHSMLSVARQRPGVRYAMDMNVAVEEVMLIVGGEARGSMLRYETNLDRSLPEVMAEPTALEQVLINLILNARDAGARLIRIATAPAPGRAGHLRLSVSDDGSGIKSDALGKMFRPFFTTKPKGTGLGLWLSQRIVQEHGGSIAVESVAGKGATFTITLPTIGESSAGDLALPPPARDKPPPAPPQAPAARSNQSGR